MRSTDEEPLHTFCPIGSESWCKYQKALFFGTVKTFKHTKCIPLAVLDAIKPVFKALSSPELLKRCVGAHTQNNNESLNSLIWQMCPKTSNCGKKIAKIAAYEAAVTFNSGRKERLTIMKEMGLVPGAKAVISFFKTDCARVKQAGKRLLDSTLEARRAKKRAKMCLNKKITKEEGPVYVSGHF